MLRFPNPGSHIDSFIKIYKELFDALSEAPFFTLDDISRTLVERNLATSSGFMGQEALTRSTREDRSRDPLYNQSKMYAELFRMLGNQLIDFVQRMVPVYARLPLPRHIQVGAV